MDALCLWWCCNTATGSFVPPTQRKYDTQWLEQKQVSKGNPEKWKRLWGWIKKRPRKHKRVETQSYAVLKVKWAKDLCFVHPSADLKPPAIEILVRFSLKFSPPPPRTGRGDFITAAPTSPLHLLDLPIPHLHLCAKLFTAITFKAFVNSLHVVPSASLNIQPLIC